MEAAVSSETLIRICVNYKASDLASRYIGHLCCYFAKHGNSDAVSDSACKLAAVNSSFQVLLLRFRHGILMLQPYFSRVGGGGGHIVHTMFQQVRLLGLGSTVPPTALDDTKGR
jgi:hypothetical protein